MVATACVLSLLLGGAFVQAATTDPTRDPLSLLDFLTKAGALGLAILFLWLFITDKIVTGKRYDRDTEQLRKEREQLREERNDALSTLYEVTGITRSAVRITEDRLEVEKERLELDKRLLELRQGGPPT